MRVRRSIPVVMLLALIAAFVFDLPVATICKSRGSPRFVDEFLENAEPFGHGVGAGFILASVFVLDPARRKRFPYVLAGSLGAGLIANIVKLIVVRTRPRSIDVFPDSVWSTFGGFLSKTQSNETQSFPSAHTATAVGLAMMLSWMYPRGRWYFTVMAILVGMQRIHTEAHFPSDVFAGAVVGWLVAVTCQYMAREPANPSA